MGAEPDQGEGSPPGSRQLGPLRQVAAKRDDLLTWLARGDAASGERLTEIHIAYRKILRRN